VELGGVLAHVGSQLQNGPEFLLFSGESFDSRFSGQAALSETDFPEFDVLRTLCGKIRSLIIEVLALEEQKKKLGI